MRVLFTLLLICLVASPAFGAEDSAAAVSLTHRMMMLALQLGVILFAAKAGGMLAEKLKMPGVLGELGAGVAIGPFALGCIPFPGFAQGLFPVGSGGFPVSPELYGICSVAAIVLLFMTGLETDLRLLIRFSVAGSVIGVGGVLASFVVGDLTGVFFARLLFAKSLGFFSPECLFLGAISTATSVGITARVLSEKRKLDSPEGVTILAGAVIDDVLGIVLLAMVLGVVSATRATGSVDWGHVGVMAAKAVGIWLAATAIALAAARRIGLLLKLFRERSSIAVMALGLALLLAGLFEEAGLAMIIGAYIAGLALSRTDISYVIREKIAPVYAFLVPIFFCVMGMLVDVGAMTARPVLAFGAIYTVTAIAAKLLGSGVPTYLFGFNTRGAARIGFGMAPRGEVALVIAGIGLAAGVLVPKVFGVAIMMTLLTTVLGPMTLGALYRNPAPGMRKKIEQRESQLTFEFASREIAQFLLAELRGIFESEGFYVHLLDRSQNIHQLRKDTVVIGMQRQDHTLVFTCDARDAAFVNTAVYEVLGDLERTIRGLQKPVDAAAIVHRIRETSSTPSRGRILARFLRPGLLKPRLDASDKAGIIDELLDMLHRNGLVRDAAEARKAVLEREESMSTGMEKGIAIPHGRTEAVSGLVCAIGLKPEGVDFKAFDGRPSRIFVLTLSPVGTAAPHVQFMSEISQVLDDERREQLLRCSTSHEMYDVLTARPVPSVARPTPAETAPAGPARSALRLEDYLDRDGIVFDPIGETREEVIDTLLKTLHARGKIRDLDEARETVFKREAAMSTAIENHIAIPHVRTDAVDRLVCAVGIRRDGVDFGARNGDLSHIVVLTLSPASKPAPHVQFMADIARAFSADVRRKVLAARSGEEVFRILSGGAESTV